MMPAFDAYAIAATDWKQRLEEEARNQVQAAWACWRSTQSATLRPWVEQLAVRRGRRIAVVALARRLSRILYALWRDGATFDRSKLAAAA